MTDNRQREEIIEKWILAIVQDGGLRRLDDLHIDKVDPTWKNRDHWVEGGLEAFRVARVVRDRNGLPHTVALAFSLKSGNRPLGVDFQTRAELDERLDWSPPSLYLFHRSEEPRGRISLGDAAQDLSPSLFGIPETDFRCYYLEFLQQDADEYCRSVSIEDYGGDIDV